ncbi:MAG: cation diffusion facilitator family transporter [Verrucomicrobiota bacterium]
MQDAGKKSEDDRSALLFAMNLSLGVGIFMVLLKGAAFLLTGSSAILSDAAESVVHAVAVIFASYSLRLSFQPADENHHYGHSKIAFFSMGFEGGMITLAALYILEASIQNWMSGIKIEHLGIGTVFTLLAIFINGTLGRYLIRLGKRKNSNILVANGHHTFTDCWTGIAVLVGLGLVLATDWLPFDPVCGILMALNIIRTGVSLMRSAFAGLMDQADPEAYRVLTTLLESETKARAMTYHQVRIRHLGDAHEVAVHLVFPQGESLHDAHVAATEIEMAIQVALAPAYVTTHLECAGNHDTIHPQNSVNAGAFHS